MTKPRSMVIAGLFVAEVRRDGAAADGDEQEVGLEGLAVLEGDLDAVVVLLDALEEDAGGELDAALLEGALEGLDDRGVLVRNQRREAFDDRDVDAERLPDRSELDADHAAAEDDRALGDVVHGRGLRRR